LDKPGPGDIVGCQFGYNDNDNVPLKCDHLRHFPNNGHWVRTYEIDQATGDTLDTILHAAMYTDLEFAHGLPPDDPQRVIIPLEKLGALNADIRSVQYFSMDGRRMVIDRKNLNIYSNGVILRREQYINGTSRTRPVYVTSKRR
jgi:hypothetical protein